ncbi:lytic transglycosylase domain-containing protein [Asticcacaulis endophyticus]|nr:lytic transglycosylase domain-containing protein [Asticcacaulis endophyticus]
MVAGFCHSAMAAESKPSKETATPAKATSKSKTVAKSKADSKAKIEKASKKSTKEKSSETKKTTPAKVDPVKPTPPRPEPLIATPNQPVPYQAIAVAAPVLPTLIAKGQPATGNITPWDAERYDQAFNLIAKGDFEGAQEKSSQIADETLKGYLEFYKLFNGNYSSSYGELTAWLERYSDLPMSMRVWSLAKRKKPDGESDPPLPALAKASPRGDSDSLRLASLNPVAGINAVAAMFDRPEPSRTESTSGSLNPDSSLTPKSARSAYNNNQLEQAVKLGVQVGDRWVAGLASYRLKRYTEAEKHFDFVINDPSQNAWSQSGAAYWAARAALMQNQKDEADRYLRIAASFPFTFYGLVAEQRLGIEPAVALAQKGLPPALSNDPRNLARTLSDDFEWTKTNDQAKRVTTLMQIGRTNDARAELQDAMQRASDDTTRNHWLALATYHKLSVSKLKSSDRLFDSSSYLQPDYEPKGGFAIDKALVFAIARKESKFNPKAQSYAGAYGLMQLMPATAALVTGDKKLLTKPAALLDPETNLTIGQEYIQRLLAAKPIGGDILRAVAAYNAGPRPVQDAVNALGPDADALLIMESIPVAQTRQYVEEVIAAYWIYSHLMGETPKSLKHAAQDVRAISLN